MDRGESREGLTHSITQWVIEYYVARVFVTRRFEKFAKSERLEDFALLERIAQAEQGLVDARLRGCLVKLRIARKGSGRSGGYRTIVAFRSEDKAFFLYGFAKNVADNITGSEAEELDQAGQLLLGLSDDDIQELTINGRIRELFAAELQ